MTPKEKANELIEKFRMYDVSICDLMGRELDGYEERYTKQCALICVEEMIKYKSDLEKEYQEDYHYLHDTEEYLEEVKQEIEKL